MVSRFSSIIFGHIHLAVTAKLTTLRQCALNTKKGQLPLEDFRVKLRLDEFFSTGDRLTLRHLLSFLVTKGSISAFGKSITTTQDDEMISDEFASGVSTNNLYECPTTGWSYFYATLNVALLDSDDEFDDSVGLQPQYLISDKVFSLFRHFAGHPYEPSIGRLSKSRIRLFDGQHKIAALLLNGRQDFECKIYVNPYFTLAK